MTPEVREQGRREFIAHAIELLNRSLDYAETLRALVWVAVPTIADWCAVDIVEDGALHRLAVAHVDPAKIERAQAFLRRWPTDLAGSTGIAALIRDGRSDLVTDITDAMLDQAVADPEQRAELRQLGLRSYIAVPLRRGDDVIGVISLAMAESGRRYDAGDLDVAIRLADRASTAIEKAHMFREIQRGRIAIAEERDRLVQIISTLPIAVAVMRGPDLVFEIVNGPFERTFGGRSLHGLRQADLGPNTSDRVARLRAILETGVPSEFTELAVTYDWDGSGNPTLRYFDGGMAPMRAASGEIDGVISYSTDVTERVIGRQHLEVARKTAEQANRVKDEFLAMLGHELRNPLAPILTALDLMQLRAPEVFERERTVIQRQVRHVVRLVDDLLDISRITRGTLELHREDLDIVETIGKAIEIASPLLEERNHELVTSYARGLIVNGDGVRLAQVIANLLTNAAKFTERGGTISVSAVREGNRIAVRVADSGVGIEVDVIPHVFEQFFQSRQAIDRAQGGLGLGLAIVRTLVELHGGTVEAASAGPGKGSEFTVWLEAVEHAERIRPALGAPIKGAAPPRTAGILIVDDNADALSLLSDALEARGLLVFRAHDAPSALAEAQRTMPRLALLDIGLPVMDGYELGRRLREIPGLEVIKLVAVTGYGQASDLERSRTAGFDGHLVKPISLDKVQATIQSLLA